MADHVTDHPQQAAKDSDIFSKLGDFAREHVYGVSGDLARELLYAVPFGPAALLLSKEQMRQAATIALEVASAGTAVGAAGAMKAAATGEAFKTGPLAIDSGSTATVGALPGLTFTGTDAINIGWAAGTTAAIGMFGMGATGVAEAAIGGAVTGAIKGAIKGGAEKSDRCDIKDAEQAQKLSAADVQNLKDTGMRVLEQALSTPKDVLNHVAAHPIRAFLESRYFLPALIIDAKLSK